MFRTERRLLEAWCAYVEDCQFVPPPRQYMHEWETTEEACWQADGSATVDAKLGLVTRLLAKINANVEVGGQISGCRTTTERESFLVFIANCIDTEYWEEFGVVDVEGTVTEIEGGIRIACSCDGTGSTVHDVFCNPRTSTGNAAKVTFVHFRTTESPCCISPPEGPPCCGCGAGA